MKTYLALLALLLNSSAALANDPPKCGDPQVQALAGKLFKDSWWQYIPSDGTGEQVNNAWALALGWKQGKVEPKVSVVLSSVFQTPDKVCHVKATFMASGTIDKSNPVGVIQDDGKTREQFGVFHSMLQTQTDYRVYLDETNANTFIVQMGVTPFQVWQQSQPTPTPTSNGTPL